MERDFERFQGGPNEAASLRLHITIDQNGRIVLNRNAFYKLGKPAAVFLYYSRERDTIGVESTSPRFNQAFPVIPAGAGWRINGASFCRHFGIDIDTRLKFVQPEIEGTTLRLKLAETISVSGRLKKKRG